jgi:tryptophanyl-tRNA synthetase
LIDALEPIREKRRFYEERPQRVEEVIQEGCRRARNVARNTMEEVRAAIHI